MNSWEMMPCRGVLPGLVQQSVNLSRPAVLVHGVGVMTRDRDYAALYRELGPQLWRAIYVYSGGRRDVANDAVGEAFVRAIENDRNIRRPLPWLYQVAFRIAAAELRTESAPLSSEEIYLDDPATGDLMRAMRRLTRSQRAAVFLHYQADLPIREVARLMGTSTAAVKVHLHRGRKRLREMLGTEEVNDA
jgi:RNA polymerase sigma-70 factor (ECF subfamily)